MQQLQNMSTKKIATILTIIIVILLTIIFYFYKNNNVMQDKIMSLQDPGPSTFTDEHYKAIDYVAENEQGWATYKNDNLKIEFKYPPILNLGTQEFNSPNSTQTGTNIGLCLPPYGCQDSSILIRVIKNIPTTTTIESYLETEDFYANKDWKNYNFQNYPGKISDGVIVIKKDTNLYILMGPSLEQSQNLSDYENIIKEFYTGILSSFKFL